MRPGYQQLRHQCYMCHRFMKDCNANLCNQRRSMMHYRHPSTDTCKRAKFAMSDNIAYQPYLRHFAVVQQPTPIQYAHQTMRIPAQVPSFQYLFPKMQQNEDQLYNLYVQGELVGNIHTVVMKYCISRGMLVDCLISVAATTQREKNHTSSEYNFLLPGSTGMFHRIENIILPWSILPESVSKLPVNIQMQTTSQYIPPGSTFKVFCDSYDEHSNVATFKMANRSSPVLQLPPYIQTKLTFSDRPLQRTLETQNPTNRPRFLIILDFEATCDFSPNPLITRETSEIIEFPWIVMDTQTLDIVYKRQIYVKPQRIEGITNYCSQLTGITQNHCENGLSLADAIQEFELYLKDNLFPFGENSFRIITDGIWDLEIQLQLEAKRKGITLGNWFRNYFDVRQEFKQFYSWFTFPPSSPTLQAMLDAYSLNFIGRHHSGLDDCQSIAQIVKVLLQLHPNTFTHPKEFKQEDDPLKKAFPYSACCPPGSWCCENTNCGVWNQPYVFQCKFCKTEKPKNFPV